MENFGSGFWLLVGLLIAVFAFLFLYMLVQLYHDFNRELRYLNNEIGRSEGEKKKFWLSRRRRLWLSLIPFVRY